MAGMMNSDVEQRKAEIRDEHDQRYCGDCVGTDLCNEMWLLEQLEAQEQNLRELRQQYDGPSVDEWMAMLNEKQARIEALEQSMVDHFQNEHLAGDGPEIDRWKRRVEALEKQNDKFTGFIQNESGALDFWLACATRAALKEKPE